MNTEQIRARIAHLDGEIQKHEARTAASVAALAATRSTPHPRGAMLTMADWQCLADLGVDLSAVDAYDQVHAISIDGSVTLKDGRVLSRAEFEAGAGR